jgi:hypothetical protein
MNNDRVIEYIDSQRAEYSQLCHANNIFVKWNDSKLTKKQREALENIVQQYYTYLKSNIDLDGFSEEDITKRVKYLNEYYNYYNEKGYDYIFTSQGKFRSTILEEFMFILFKDYIDYLKREYKDDSNAIHGGAAKAYTNLYFTSTNFENFVKAPTIEINVKDQDFAIYREFDLKINEKTKHLRIPIVAIEDKTYIDKTMLEGIIATAEKIKNGNPYALFIAVAENYDVDLSVDPAYSRIDQIYVLRKCKRKEAWADIDPAVVIKLFNEVKKHIERPWSDVESKMRKEGVII